MAWPTVFWFLLSWDKLTQNAETHENWGTFQFGNIVYVIHRSNNYGNFMEFLEYVGVEVEALLSYWRETKERVGRSVTCKYCG
jgi:hypothetical protein